MDVAGVRCVMEGIVPVPVSLVVVLLVSDRGSGRPLDKSLDREVNAEEDESLVLLLSLDFFRMEGGFELEVDDCVD